MIAFLGCLALLAILVGHVGLHLAIYNRLNATGFTRRRIKQIEKLFVGTMLAIPLLALWFDHNTVLALVTGQLSVASIPTVTLLYAVLCLSTWAVLGIPWLLWRPMFRLEWVDAPRTITRYRVDDEVDKPLARSIKCKWESRLPFNQIFELAVECIALPVPQLPHALEGYRIAQLSDIHLTGDIEPDYTAFVIEQANRWKPDLFALTGDVIDKQPCVEWLDDLFSKANCPDGCYFILGNHDKRIADPGQTRSAMTAAGWTDLGGRAITVGIRGANVEIIGNEHPWFQRPVLGPAAPGTFRLLLSHSPDQLTWARRNDVHLMLAGHTHGGQGRLPLAGPLMSPSYHGSRFASGDFYKSPTTLHVSRGLAGVHLLRLWCPPELSLLELRKA